MQGSDGRTVLGGNFLRTWRNHGLELILAEIAIKSSWMDRSLENTSFLKLTADFAVTLSQVVMVKQSLEEFIEDINHWGTSQEKIAKSLCPARPKEQECVFYIGPPDENRLEKTIFEVQYSGVAFPTGKWSFGVDQSSIRIFSDELNKSLQELGYAA